MSEPDFEAAMTAHWLQSRIGPREAAAKLRPACGNVVPLDEATLEKLETEWRKERNAFHIVLAILGGAWNRLAGFDCEELNRLQTTRAKFVIWQQVPEIGSPQRASNKPSSQTKT